MQQNKLTVIGVTGITGSGTSTVSAILAERGGFVAHADKLAHEAMAKSEPAYKEILAAFGREILSENGEINRRVLGTKVFGSKADLEKLEKIIHPRVIERTNKMIEKITESDSHAFAVIDAPLLTESNLHKICDSIWLVTAPDALRISRITARDNIDDNAAIRRLQSRAGGDAPLREHANIIIQNDGSPIALRSKIETVLKAMSLRKFGWDGLDVLEI
ncbi:MAG: dephospho-CoA kinase [Defluviitaleaceae bacterium]|nr:dephospho-CoA kinase [Defluviitaleaceae bacterium]